MPSPSLSALPGFEQRIVVGVGDLAVSNNPAVHLATYSLGSCVGVTLYDPVKRVGGMLHVMLPDSSINPTKAAQLPAMFADTGMSSLFRTAFQMRADPQRMIICVAGGAQMMDQEGVFNIGRRNSDAVLSLLRSKDLSVRALEVGGIVSRTITLCVNTGEVRLKTSASRQDAVLSLGR